MKKFILILLIAIMPFSFSSCVSSQTTYTDYQKIYFDYVVYGHVDSYDYVWDGTYSYHILGIIPENIYWELYPSGWEVYIYDTNMIRLRLFDYNRRYIFYNRGFHNYYRFDNRHRPPFNPNMRNGRPDMRNWNNSNMMRRRGNINGTPNRNSFNKPNFNMQNKPNGNFQMRRGSNSGFHTPNTGRR